MEKMNNFCPVFKGLQQLAAEKNLLLENTVLNKVVCPFAQACLALAGPDQYNLLIENCQLWNIEPPLTIYLNQPGPKPYNPTEAFFRRLKKTAQMNNW